MKNRVVHNPHLEGDPFLWEAGPVGILLLHGLTATTAEVRPLAHRLHEQGYTVAGPLLPGHGTTPAALNEVRWRDWVWEAEQKYQHLATICDAVFVGGESTGAVLALYLAGRYADVRGVLAYAPAIKLALPMSAIIRLYLFAPLIATMPKQNLDDNAYWQGYKVNPLRAVVELIRLGRAVRHRLPQIRQPVLVMQGRRDRTIDPDCGRIILQGIRSEIKELHWLENSSHVILLEGELDKIVVLTERFIQR